MCACVSLPEWNETTSRRSDIEGGKAVDGDDMKCIDDTDIEASGAVAKS